MALLDFNFQRVEWWRGVINVTPPGDSRQRNLGDFGMDEAMPLARDLLMEAWSACRSAPNVVGLVFGMAPDVAQLIARLLPSEIDRVLAHEAHELGLRWENRPSFWKDLFHAATQVDDWGLSKVHLHCLQLFGGDWMSSHSNRAESPPAVKGPINEVSVA
jgi:hypothetical protein